MSSNRNTTPEIPEYGRGSVFVISAPSGAGKTSLVRALVENDPALRISVSHTTRAIRPGEVDGDHYYFVNRQTFQQMSSEGAFIEHAHVFGNDYGTSLQWVENQRQAGYDIILEIDWQGAHQVREKVGDSIGIFILPPSLEQLERRLRQRQQDSATIIGQRMKAAVEEIHHYSEYPYLVINDDFTSALVDLRAIITSHRLRQSRQSHRHATLLHRLLATEHME